MGGVPGFDGRPEKARLERGGAMTTADPNADLVGFSFPVDTGGVGTVTGTPRWNPAYVTVDTPHGITVRVAAQVRRRKELS